MYSVMGKSEQNLINARCITCICPHCILIIVETLECPLSQATVHSPHTYIATCKIWRGSYILAVVEL